MQIISWIITVIAIVGAILNVRQSKYGFALWMISNSALMFYNFHINQYAQTGLFAVYLGLSIWGWFTWKAESPTRVNLEKPSSNPPQKVGQGK